MPKRSALSKVEFEICILSPDYGPEKLFRQLYHYTNDNAKQSIVIGDKLDFQLTKTNAFLDQNEGTSVLEPYYHACGQLYETGQIDFEFYMIARSITMQALRDCNSNLWALCLTPHGCSPFMKERYAPKDGWIISFFSEYLDDLVLNFPKKYGRFVRIQIQYSFKRIKRLLQDVLKKVFIAYKKDSEIYGSAPKEQARQILLHAVYYYGLRYKGKDYREEKEERLLFDKKSNVQPFSWASKSKKIAVIFNNDTEKEAVHLILGPSRFHQAVQELNSINDERLNSLFLSGKTIQKVLNDQNT